MCGMVLSMVTALVEFLVRKKKENNEKEKVRNSKAHRLLISEKCSFAETPNSYTSTTGDNGCM